MKKGISQEGLKLIACITMLIDHIGYRIIFPLYSCAVSGKIYTGFAAASVGFPSPFSVFCW